MSFLKSIIFISLLFVINDGEQDDETILWESDKKLNWEDFKGEPQNQRAAAVTASGLTYRFSTTKNNGEVIAIDYEVTSFFYPNISWYRPEVCDDIILGHEQLHFDITELYARKFRKLLSEKKFTNDAKNEIKVIYQEINTALNDFQNQYDKETNFSRNREQQSLWSKNIEKALKAY
ncbi:DUF922 domain-containing protein [Cellulophaga sp. HaHaR_3_176]|uniref:DUF922 domain-containing protein n=1 Tax=Cellulophaga sp. HaHaR_3_176 TaxID=1942464 RepID=UPI001C1F7222|nr:DUF922 domain-containing protein [Cellulophaga sp. HaHaR_3_176]QWX84548.1 DUF922 domain-containing protein [Cellulophaga sp. HaHaR_3_176]